MRLTIPQPQFLKTLQAVERAVNDRSTLPILTNVLLEVQEGELTLTATDLDVGIRCRLPLPQPVEQGAVALPARKLTTIIRELPEDAITLEARKNHTATLQCGASSFRIPGLPAEDFPTLPTTEPDHVVTIPQHTLRGLITRTAHAMSMEETRFILNGALLSAQKGELVVVATDGRRLALARGSLNEPATQPFQAIVPAKAIRELGRLLQDDADDVTIAPLKENQLSIRFGPVVILTRLIEGQFPQYEKVIPPPSKQIAICNRQLLTSAIRRASLMTTAASQAVIFELTANRLIVLKESAELGSAREELPVTYPGPSLTVAFNPEFWLDVLKTLDADEVAIEIAGPDRPAVIRQPDFTFLVLPMKVS